MKTNLKTIELPLKGAPWSYNGRSYVVETALNTLPAVSNIRLLPPTMWVRARDNGALYETSLVGNRTHWTTPKAIAGAYVRQ